MARAPTYPFAPERHAPRQRAQGQFIWARYAFEDLDAARVASPGKAWALGELGERLPPGLSGMYRRASLQITKYGSYSTLKLNHPSPATQAMFSHA